MAILRDRLEPSYNFLWRKPGQDYLGLFIPVTNKDHNGKLSLLYKRVGLLTINEIKVGLPLLTVATIAFVRALSN